MSVLSPSERQVSSSWKVCSLSMACRPQRRLRRPAIQARGPRLIALSGHDSTPWTFDAFTRRFGGRYGTLRAGEELRITAANA